MFSKRRLVGILIFSLLIALTLAFIFSNSFDNAEESSEKSGFVTKVITPVLEIFMGKGNVTEHFVRKLAHFTEFFALGLESSLLAFFVLRRRRVGFFACLLFGLLSALTDETIQMFTGRGPSVADVWLDYSGFVIAFAIIYIIHLVFFVRNIARAIKKK